MNTNQKQLAVWAGATALFSTSLVISKILDLKKAKAQAAKAEAQRLHSAEVWKRLDDVRSTLDRQLETAKFWEQVTGPEM